MVRKHFRWHNGDGQWQLGATLRFWDSFVRSFFETYPKGELHWTHDTCS